MTLTKITSKSINDGEIINADINASAAIAGSKISPSFTTDITIAEASPSILFSDVSGSPQDPDYRILVNAGKFEIYDETNSTTRLLTDSSGNIGIGTTSPDTNLHVHKASAGSASSDGNSVLTLENDTHCILQMLSPAANSNRIMFGDPSDNNAGELNYDHNINAFLIKTNGSEQVRVNSSGNVGFGTANATAKVHANSSANTATFLAEGEVDNPSYPAYGFSGQNADNGSRGAGMYLPGDSTLAFSTAGNERLRIDAAGRIGIGTGSPDKPFEIRTETASHEIFAINRPATGTAALYLGNDSSNNALISANNSSLIFGKDLSGTFSEYARINTSGNFGIGDTDPDQKLVVQGSGTTVLKVENTDDGTAQITLGNVGSSNIGIKQNNGECAFDIGGTEKMRIRGDGLVIGDTVHSSAGNRLTVKATSAENCVHFDKVGNGNKSILSLQHGRATGGTVGNGIIFRQAGGANVGEIEITNTQARTVNFSDYRMKENIADITNALNTVKNLAPKTFNYIHDETKKVLTGFIAHEVQTVLPQAVTGDKDAVITQALIDSDDAPEGGLGDPIYQKICITDFIPTLTAALKEAITKIETLETKVAALEAA